MKRLTWAGLAIGLSLLYGRTLPAQTLTNYWSFAQSNFNGTSFNDLAGSDPATPSFAPSGYNYITGAGGAYSTGAGGLANGAATVVGPNLGGANGFTTSLATFGAGTAGSPWSYEFMFLYTAPGYRFGYQTDRAGGPITLFDGYALGNQVYLNVGAAAVWPGDGTVWRPTSGQWYDIALTYDGSILDLYVTPYSKTVLTPILLASYASTTLAATSTSYAGLGIGCCDGSRYGNYGAYDWAAVYNTALTPAQIATHIDNDSGLTYTWFNGAGATANLSDSGNWSSGLPSAGAELAFGPLTGGQNAANNDTFTSVAGIRFLGLSDPQAVNSSAYTLSGNSLTLTGPINNDSTNDQVINLPVALALGSGTINTVTNNVTVNGAISSSGAIGITKTGSGTLLLTATNTYSGPTTIDQGKLDVNGWLTNSAVTVQSGGILSGTGSLTSVTVNSGGTLAPGDPLGVLHLNGGLVLSAGAVVDYELDGPGASDEVSMPGQLLSLADQQFSDFNFMALAGFRPGIYTLIDAGSISGSLGSNLSGTIDGYTATLAVQGTDLVLNVVPEPSTFALLAAGGIGLLGYAWRRRKRIPGLST